MDMTEPSSGEQASAVDEPVALTEAEKAAIIALQRVHYFGALKDVVGAARDLAHRMAIASIARDGAGLPADRLTVEERAVFLAVRTTLDGILNKHPGAASIFPGGPDPTEM